MGKNMICQIIFFSYFTTPLWGGVIVGALVQTFDFYIGQRISRYYYFFEKPLQGWSPITDLRWKKYLLFVLYYVF